MGDIGGHIGWNFRHLVLYVCTQLALQIIVHSLLVGAFGFTIMKMWYGQTRQNFNRIFQYESQTLGQGPELTAMYGLGFTCQSSQHHFEVKFILLILVIWVFFGFCCLPVGVSVMVFPIETPQDGRNVVRVGHLVRDTADNLVIQRIASTNVGRAVRFLL